MSLDQQSPAVLADRAMVPHYGEDWSAAAESALRRACSGWRERGRCTDSGGRRLLHPHEACLQAQYAHDLILIEHGLLHVAD